MAGLLTVWCSMPLIRLIECTTAIQSILALRLANVERSKVPLKIC